MRWLSCRWIIHADWINSQFTQLASKIKIMLKHYSILTTVRFCWGVPMNIAKDLWIFVRKFQMRNWQPMQAPVSHDYRAVACIGVWSTIIMHNKGVNDNVYQRITHCKLFIQYTRYEMKIETQRVATSDQARLKSSNGSERLIFTCQVLENDSRISKS